MQSHSGTKTLTPVPELHARLPRATSRDLLHGGRRLIIEHGGEEYCLRLTRNERLILTKN